MSATLTPLPRAFYAAPVLVLARAMIGKVLVHASSSGLAAGRIVETEAYRGPEDLAAHSARGRRTRRTEVMFGPPGRAYVYFVYGMHWAFNVVAGEDGDPHAVLVRAVEPVAGAELMAARRGLGASELRLTNGPGKLCRALGIEGVHGGLDLTRGEIDPGRSRGRDSIFLADGAAGPIGRARRVNVDYAGAWADKPWRFYEKASRFVSVPPR